MGKSGKERRKSEIGKNTYRELYYMLFGRIADAVDALESNAPEAAKALLINAMREAEERVIGAEEE